MGFEDREQAVDRVHGTCRRIRRAQIGRLEHHPEIASHAREEEGDVGLGVQVPCVRCSLSPWRFHGGIGYRGARSDRESDRRWEVSSRMPGALTLRFGNISVTIAPAA